MDSISNWDAATIEASFTQATEAAGIKKGAVMLPLRIMLVGGKYGPGVFDIAEMIGKEEMASRIKHTISLL